MKPIYVTIPVEQELPKKAHIDIAARQYWKENKFPKGESSGEADFIAGVEWMKMQLKPITELSDLPEEWKEAIKEIAGKSFDAGRSQDQVDGAWNNDKQEHINSIFP